MKCKICNADAENGLLILGEGFVCSEDCAQISQARHEKYLNELDSEELLDMPDQFETKDFERWCLKCAMNWLRNLSAKDRKFLGKSNPMLLLPGQLALYFKEQILQNLHPAYHSEINHHGHDRFFSRGTYCLRQPVPKAKIIEAAQKADLLTSEATY
jgi:hypothetical protein